MPPEQHIVPRFAAEPSQSVAPQGEWEARLRERFLLACADIEAEDGDGGEVGEPGPLVWFPDRTWSGRTFIPVTSRTSTGLELFGFVSFAPNTPEGEDPDIFASADVTDEVAERNPDWRVDLCDEVVGGWRGADGEIAAMTLVWGRPLIDGAVQVTAELGSLTVDGCSIEDGRFTLLAPDHVGGDLLEVHLFGPGGEQLAAESLYE